MTTPITFQSQIWFITYNGDTSLWKNPWHIQFRNHADIIIIDRCLAVLTIQK